MEELNESTLRAAVSGREKAFKELYNWYIPFVWRIAYKTSQDKEIAEEIVQESFIKIHSSLGKFRSECALSTWIYRIVYNTASSFLSKVIKARLHDPYEDTFHGEYRADRYDEREMMNLILSHLTPQERFLLVAREVDNISFEEIAVITNETAGALRTKLTRLKNKIREQFAIEPVVKEVV
jgi:RNA polymerase sigma-70 factor (ECF subfamily)